MQVFGHDLRAEYRGLNNENRVFGVCCTVTIIRNPQNTIGNYSGQYIKL